MKRFTLLFALGSVATLGAQPAIAGETCYGFGAQTPGQTLSVGQRAQMEHLRVRIHQYEKAVPVAGDQFVQVRSSANAGGSAPEIYTYQANLLIEPRRPVTQIRLRVGESRGGPANPIQGHANIVFNGTRHVVTGGLNALDGREFGGSGGTIRIEVQMTQNAPDSNWWSGTMKVTAKSTEIASFGIGGIPVAVDDVCFTPNGA